MDYNIKIQPNEVGCLDMEFVYLVQDNDFGNALRWYWSYILHKIRAISVLGSDYLRLIYDFAL
jgi:hypothetical protein